MNTHDDNEGGIATLEAPLNTRQKATPPPVHDNWGDEDEEATGFKKWRAPLIVGVLTIVGIGYAVKALSKADGSNVKKESVPMVDVLPAPPPPPPPPPPPEQMKQEEMEKQEEDKEPEPDPEPAASTAVKGPATGGIQIAAGNRGNFFKRPDAGNKSKFGIYAGQVQSRISDALRSNKRTRTASIRVEVRIWADTTGRVTRATLGTSTGDAGLDAAIRDEVLVGLQLQQPPPEGMKMPIVMRITARRPQ